MLIRLPPVSGTGYLANPHEIVLIEQDGRTVELWFIRDPEQMRVVFQTAELAVAWVAEVERLVAEASKGAAEVCFRFGTGNPVPA